MGLVFVLFSSTSTLIGASAAASATPRPRVLVLGGTGRIGTACATHLLRASAAPIHVILTGRSETKAARALEEVCTDALQDAGSDQLSFRQCDWTDPISLAAAVADADAVIHSAGTCESD